MSEVPQTFTLSVKGMNGIRILTETQVTVDSGENRSLPTVVDVLPESIAQSNTEIIFHAQSETDASLKLETESRFVGPTQ